MKRRRRSVVDLSDDGLADMVDRERLRPRWRPIEDAPEGVSLFLAARSDRAWKYGVGVVLRVDGGLVLFDWPWSFHPTHWQLPEPPSC